MYGYAVGLGERSSIHALLAESDFMYPSQQLSQPVLLSTLSLRRATWTA